MAERRRQVAWVGAAGASVLAVIWLFVQPEALPGSRPAAVFLLRWGHSLCWALLALLCALIALDAAAPLRRIVAVSAGIAYAGFLAALLGLI